MVLALFINELWLNTVLIYNFKKRKQAQFSRTKKRHQRPLLSIIALAVALGFWFACCGRHGD